MIFEPVESILTEPAGTSMVYWRGHIARQALGSELAHATAKKANELIEAGLITVFHRRHGPHDYDYIAVRTSGTKPLKRGGRK